MAKCIPVAGGRLSLLINDHVEQTLNPQKKAELQRIAGQQGEVNTFMNQSRRGKMALNKAFKVKAADDFEERLAQRIEKNSYSSSL